MSNNKLMELLSDDDFLAKILSLDTKEEVKNAFLENGLEVNENDIEFLRVLFSSMINDIELSEEELKQTCGGRVDLHNYAKALSTPFKMLSYGIAYGAGYAALKSKVLMIAIKGMIEGFWTSWRA